MHTASTLTPRLHQHASPPSSVLLSPQTDASNASVLTEIGAALALALALALVYPGLFGD